MPIRTTYVKGHGHMDHLSYGVKSAATDAVHLWTLSGTIGHFTQRNGGKDFRPRSYHDRCADPVE